MTRIQKIESQIKKILAWEISPKNKELVLAGLNTLLIKLS